MVGDVVKRMCDEASRMLLGEEQRVSPMTGDMEVCEVLAWLQNE